MCNCAKVFTTWLLEIVYTHSKRINAHFVPSRAFRSRSESLLRVGLHVHDGSQIQDGTWTSRAEDWNSTATQTAQFAAEINPLITIRWVDIWSAISQADLHQIKKVEKPMNPALVMFLGGEETIKIVRLKMVFGQVVMSVSPGKDLRDGLWSRVGGSKQAVPQGGRGAGWGLQPLTGTFFILQNVINNLTNHLLSCWAIHAPLHVKFFSHSSKSLYDSRSQISKSAGKIIIRLHHLLWTL